MAPVVPLGNQFKPGDSVPKIEPFDDPGFLQQMHGPVSNSRRVTILLRLTVSKSKRITEVRPVQIFVRKLNDSLIAVRSRFLPRGLASP